MKLRSICPGLPGRYTNDRLALQDSFVDAKQHIHFLATPCLSMCWCFYALG